MVPLGFGRWFGWLACTGVILRTPLVSVIDYSCRKCCIIAAENQCRSRKKPGSRHREARGNRNRIPKNAFDLAGLPRSWAGKASKSDYLLSFFDFCAQSIMLLQCSATKEQGDNSS
jgi:hypothetical protein